MLKISQKRVYAITDCLNLSTNDLLSRSESILRQGIGLLQYRNKVVARKKPYYDLARALQELCFQYSTPFIVNDDLLLAKQLHADGIHLGFQDQDIGSVRSYLGPMMIGYSCYSSLNRAAFAVRHGADYLAFGAFFISRTRKNMVCAPVEILSSAKALFNLPIVAIGGITPKNGKALVTSGADLLAVVHGLFATANSGAAVSQYQSIFK